MNIATIDNFDQTAFPKTFSKDTIYTLTFLFANTGNVDALNVIFQSIIPPQTSYISNSSVVNGVVILGQTPISGITLNSIKPGIPAYTFSYQVMTNSSTPYPMFSQGFLDFQYIDDNGNLVNSSGASIPLIIQ